MKRGAWVALAVLVPFALLIAIGFSQLKDPPAVVLPPPKPAPLPPPVVAEHHPVEVVKPIAPPPVEVKAAPSSEPGVEAPTAEMLEELAKDPMLADVTPMVTQCFLDAKDRTREPQRVTITYGISDAGRFEHVQLKKSSWADPQIDACVLDSFEDAHPVAPLRRGKHLAHTFTFSPADAGR
jgi:hypothetical protein